MWRRSVCLANARIFTGGRLSNSIRFSSRVLEVGATPRRGDVVVDLDGAFVLPGLVNAHDHLELNHFGRLKFRPTYQSASEWIDDMRPRLREDPRIREGREQPLSDRLLIGGLKNLLSGVTTVAHHNPFYRELRRWFPTRVVRRYGWAHSFFLEGQPVGANGEMATEVKQAYRATPSEAPFLVHVAEGIDRSSREELKRLDEIGCLANNTVLVHGVGMSFEDWGLARERGAGLVWCPSSNEFLFGCTVSVPAFLLGSLGKAAPICLGTDSRLTGPRDLLEELRAAREAAPSVTPTELLGMVTTTPARLLRLPHAGDLVPGAPADFIIVPRLDEDPAGALLAARRSDLLLVSLGGRPLVGAPEMSPIFTARRVATRTGQLDGAARLFDRALARRMARSAIAESGLELL
ncbi:MAG TPA: amidohydrolase family protein [Vicinamibacteria bacterium]|nr:amidohydrolase family protein [Vicinamibacteria bacterium]